MSISRKKSRSIFKRKGFTYITSNVRACTQVCQGRQTETGACYGKSVTVIYYSPESFI